MGEKYVEMTMDTAPLPLDVDRSRASKPWLVLALLLGGVIAASIAMAAFHICKMPAAQGEVAAVGNESSGAFAHPALKSAHFYKQATYSRLALLSMFAMVICLAAAYRDGFRRLMRAIWLTPGHPMNLAIYRIVLFATILFNLDHDTDYSTLQYFAAMPRALHIAPTGMEHILPHLKITPALAWWTLTLMNIFCATAVLGLFSRLSATLVVLLGLYAMGIPQYFGQVNHYHHMLWFAAILAGSRCGDYLSIDAILNARKRADAGSTEPPGPALAYSLPLRFIWILLGICYFFPGLWKYWVSGLAWSWSDNFQHLAEWKWINMNVEWDNPGAWHPLFRMDLNPLMYRPAAMIAIIFELSFPILIFIPRIRYLAVAMGLGFHRITMATMHIPFYTLQTSYVSLIDWDKVFGWIGRRRPAMTFAYDAENASVRTVVGSLRSLDLIGNVTYVPAPALLAGAEVNVNGTTRTGAAAYRALAARNPALWLVWPLVYFIPAPAKTQAAPRTPAPRAARLFATPRLGWPVTVAAVVILPNLFMGFTRKYNGWPWACYPLFEKMRGHIMPEFDVVAIGADGAPILWDEKRLLESLTRSRYSTICRRVREARKPEALAAFWELLLKENQQLGQAQFVQFWEKNIYSSPEMRHAQPVSRVRLFQARVTPQGLVASNDGNTAPAAKAENIDTDN